MNEFATNVLGGLLQTCSEQPLTGFLRNGCCQVTDEDIGNHGVCVVMTESFLRFSRLRGNDRGLRLGDARLCAQHIAHRTTAQLIALFDVSRDSRPRSLVFLGQLELPELPSTFDVSLREVSLLARKLVSAHGPYAVVLVSVQCLGHAHTGARERERARRRA